MALTNFAVASPNGGTWSIQNTNSATVGRYHDLATLGEGATNFTKCRPGVFSGPAAAASNVPQALFVAPSSGLSMTVQPGAATVERGTLVGPYTVESTAVGTVTLATANATNPRIDRIDLQVLDGALGDNSGVSLTQFVVTTGTAAGSPAVPAAPANSIPLAQVLLPANTVTLNAGMLTDTRKSTAVRGATRLLLPGDLATDAGLYPGERRVRVHATYGLLEDFWDNGAATWRGTQILLVAQSAQTGSGSLASGSTATISSTVTVDPGWPYYIKAYGLVDFGAAVSGTVCQAALQINSAVMGTNRFAFNQQAAVTANVSFDLGSECEGNTKALGAFIGGQTVFLIAKNTPGAGGPSAMTIFSNLYEFLLEIVPALV